MRPPAEAHLQQYTIFSLALSRSLTPPSLYPCLLFSWKSLLYPHCTGLKDTSQLNLIVLDCILYCTVLQHPLIFFYSYCPFLSEFNKFCFSSSRDTQRFPPQANSKAFNGSNKCVPWMRRAHGTPLKPSMWSIIETKQASSNVALHYSNSRDLN